MTPTLLDLALKAGFSDPIEGWMGEAYEERLEAFAKLIIEHEAAKWHPYGSLDEVTRDLKAEVEASNRMLAELEALKVVRRYEPGSFKWNTPADEPVAWASDGFVSVYLPDEIEFIEDEKLTPLYTRPQPAAQWVEQERAVGYREGHQAALKQRAAQWVGLTDEQISNLWCEVSNTDFVTADTHVFARAIEAKLKDKNHG